MKPSHLRTPRTLSECYFVEGYYTVEPSMWRGRWNVQTGLDPAKKSFPTFPRTVVIPAALIAVAVIAVVVQSLI